MKFCKLKPTVIAAVVGTTSFVGTAFAQESFFDSVGVTLGGGVEYESKKTVDYFLNEKTEQSTTVQVGKVELTLPQDITAYYALKNVRYTYSDDTYANQYDRDGFKHEVLVGRRFALGTDGLIGSLHYNGIFEDTTNTGQNGGTYYSGLSERTNDQRIRPALSYWSNAGNWGLYSQFEYIEKDTNNEVSWSTDRYMLKQSGESWLIEPYTKFGNWRAGAEIYFQELKNKTDVGSLRTQEDTFTEKYFEPKLTYSFEEAGSLSLRARFAEKQTRVTGGEWSTAGDTYLSNVRKVTIGYEQSVGAWKFEGQVRRSWETETSNASWATGLEKEIVQDQISAYATYRF